MHSARLGPRDHQARTSRIQRDPVRLCSRLPGASLWGTQRAIVPTAGRVVAELHEAHTARANGAVIGPDARMLAYAQSPEGRPAPLTCSHASDGDLAGHRLVQRGAASAA